MSRFLNVHRFGNADVDVLDLKLRAMKGRDALSELFQYRLFGDIKQDQVDKLKAEDVLGQRVVISLHEQGVPQVCLSGVVSNVTLGDVTTEGRRACNFDMMPELWKLVETLDTRRHASNKVVRLMENVFQEQEVDVKLSDMVSTDDKRHPKRVNPVQYEESCFEFLVRHMREESIFYYHKPEFVMEGDQVAGEHELVVGDQEHAFFEPDPPLELRYQAVENVSPFFDVRNWDRQFNFKPGRWSVNDYDYQKAKDFAMTRSMGKQKSGQRKFNAHAGFYDKDFADHKLSKLAEKEDVCREYITATSNCPFLSPGCRFKLKGHPIGSENGEYVVTSIEHQAVDDIYGSRPEYGNRFTCVPVGRVPVTCPRQDSASKRPWPKQPLGRSAGAAVYDSSEFNEYEFTATDTRGDSTELLSSGISAESAWVVDASGAHNDPATLGTVHARTTANGANGRAEVLIKYNWETTDATAEPDKSPWVGPDASTPTSTRWVRVAQLAAGKDWGTKMIPRVGEEVIVLYLDGQQKKPVIVGSLYNSANAAAENTRTTETLKIESGQGGPSAFTKTGHFGVANGPAKHRLTAGISDTTRAVPSLKDDHVSGIRTRTVVGDNDGYNASGNERYNEILFNDQQGSEELYMHAARDMNIDVEDDMHIVVKGDVHEIVHGKYYRSVNTDHADGPVNRSVVGALSFDLDKVWEYKAIEGSKHPYKVKTEVYADTETRTKGDAKELHDGTTEAYFMGNTWEMTVAAAESFTFGFTLDIFVGLKTEIALAGTLAVYGGGVIELTGAAKFEATVGPSVNKSPVKVDLSDIEVNTAQCTIEKAELRLNQDKLHVIKADVIVLDAKLIVLNALQTITGAQTTHWIS